MAVGAASLSAMDNDAPAMVKPAADPDTATVSVPSATASSAGVKVKVPIPLDDPAAMVTVNEGTAVKSAEEAAPADTDTDTEVAVFKTGDPFGKEAVTSTIVAPLPSLTLVGFRVRVIPVGGVSLSVIVIEALFTAVKPAAVVVPDTVSASLPSTRLSSVRVRVKVPAPEDWPADMVMSNLGTAVKSAAAALPVVPSPVTDTFTTVSVVNTVDPLNVAFTVTVAAELPSAAPVWSPVVSESTSTLRSMAVGAESLSLMVTVTPLTVNPDAAPPMVRVSDDSTTLSSAAVSRKLPLSATLNRVDGMVNTKEGSVALAAANPKSPDAAVTPAAESVIAVSAS